VLIPLIPWTSSSLLSLNHSWYHWDMFGSCPIHLPHPPFLSHYQGFGKLNLKLEVWHSLLSPYILIHYAWDFLESMSMLSYTTLPLPSVFPYCASLASSRQACLSR
jgi:hypothetical protein